MAYRTLTIADVGPLSVDGLTWHPLRHALDVRGFGLNAYSAAAAGDELIEDHVEGDESGGHQELYVVLRGRARFTIDGEEVLVDAGSLVFLPDPTTRRHAVGDAPDTLVLAVGGDPAAPYEVSSWEARFRARGIFEAGDRGEGVAILRAASVEHPQDASTLYDLACLEALTGDHDEALEHLKAAIAIRPELRGRAAQDGDFDAVRERDDFPR
jgi:hypothetical protein